jgi:hypothetical protein
MYSNDAAARESYNLHRSQVIVRDRRLACLHIVCCSVDGAALLNADWMDFYLLEVIVGDLKLVACSNAARSSRRPNEHTVDAHHGFQILHQGDQSQSPGGDGANEAGLVEGCCRSGVFRLSHLGCER